MANSLNKVMLIGHLGDAVKMHYFDDKNAIGRFPLATHETYSNKSGDKITNTEWHNIVVRNKLAELCEKYLSKGDRVYIEGRIKTRQWEQDGVRRYQTEIHVNELIFLSTRKDSGQVSNTRLADESGAQSPKENAEPGDDLPF